MTDCNLIPFDIQHFDKSRSLAIEASAGTGKTYTITEIVKKLIDDGIPINKILCVTYTEKATQELRDRIRKALTEQIHKSPDQKYIEALREVDNAPIFTIHAFCKNMLAQFGFEAKLAFKQTLIPDDKVESLIQQKLRDEYVYDQVFRAMLRNHDTAVDFTKSVIEPLKQGIGRYHPSVKLLPQDPFVLLNELTRLLCKKTQDEPLNQNDYNLCMDYLEAPSFEEQQKIDSIHNYYSSIIRSLEENDLQKEIDDINAKPKRTKKDDDRIKELNKIQAFPKELQTTNGCFNGTKYSVRGSWYKIYEEAFIFFKKLKELKAKVQKNSLFKGIFLTQQLPPLYETWQTYKTSHNMQSYNDMIQRVHDAVMSNNSILRARLRETYSYAIIDEFQDTNQLQWDIFKTVFHTNPDHAVFVVGDPKQSIFSFQGTDLSVYTSAVKEIDHIQTLNTNYRATDAMIDAVNAMFSHESVNQYFGETIAFYRSESPKNKVNATLNNEALKCPIFIAKALVDNPNESKSDTPSDTSMDPEDYARATAKLIVECCELQTNGKTRLQVFDKTTKALRNVKLSDFAILTRTRSELAPIERAMTKLGIPFNRYNEQSLFTGRECAEWIALLQAIDTPNFMGKNRKLLNQALCTDFFDDRPGRNLSKLESANYDLMSNPEIKKFHAWKELARGYHWAELLEKIYADTQIEARLCVTTRLADYTKLKQIGEYLFDYLYRNRVSLEETIRHLRALNKRLEASDQEEKANVIGKITDVNAVQVLTVYAAKGLEFPVVISVIGSKRFNDQKSGPASYRLDGQKCLGYDSESKEHYKRETLEEWKRLYYVAFTRATSLMILPKFSTWSHSQDFHSLSELTNACENANSEHKILSPIDQYAWKSQLATLRSRTQAILSNVHADQDTSLSNQDALNDQALTDRQKAVKPQALMQHSYSSLAGKLDRNDEVDAIDRDGIEDDEQPSRLTMTEIDQNAVAADINYAPTTNDENYQGYPAGNRPGNAVHEVFAEIDFQGYDTKELDHIIEDKFRKFALPVSKHNIWREKTPLIVKNTLNAKLPVINGAQIDVQHSFQLSELAQNEHRAEVAFLMNADAQGMRNLMKGFIDLVICRNDVYSILDWKTDKLTEHGTVDQLKDKVDDEYSVQRVLYAYTLIQWLKQFYPNLDERSIFEQHFGGIYYVFVKYTQAGTPNGVYAQTWTSFDELKTSYENVKTLMTRANA